MSSYQESVNQRLTEVYETHSDHQTRELDAIRIVLLSDLHKGRRDGADDFEQCERVYLAALSHYWREGYELWLLGDVEELWENRPQPVIDAYENVLIDERSFAAAGDRYARIVGNHDDEWYDPAQVAKHLGPYLAGNRVIEGVRLAVQAGGRPLGELFLVHGHHGTLDSDRFAGLSAWVVRHIWRPIQRLFGFKSNTPSNNFQLKEQHEQAMYAWAAGRPGQVLFAGHTHHPVWEGLSYEQAVQREVATRGLAPDTERAWIDQQIRGQIVLPGEKPCYFNTGCCSFGDATITGVELADGEIRLVRWQGGESPRVELFPPAQLREVLAAVA